MVRQFVGEGDRTRWERAEDGAISRRCAVLSILDLGFNCPPSPFLVPVCLGSPFLIDN